MYVWLLLQNILDNSILLVDPVQLCIEEIGRQFGPMDILDANYSTADQDWAKALVTKNEISSITFLSRTKRGLYTCLYLNS